MCTTQGPDRNWHVGIFTYPSHEIDVLTGVVDGLLPSHQLQEYNAEGVHVTRRG